MDIDTRRDIKNIAVNLNFDMLGSPNFVRFVYDGDGSDTPVRVPSGSANVEDVFLGYFASQGLALQRRIHRAEWAEISTGSSTEREGVLALATKDIGLARNVRIAG